MATYHERVLRRAQGGRALPRAVVPDDLWLGPERRSVPSSHPRKLALMGAVAIIHYQPEPATCARIARDQLYLCDSGGTSHVSFPSGQRADEVVQRSTRTGRRT
jgi:hypothetical protein